MHPKLLKKGIYAITPDQADSSLLFAQVEQALQGGISLLQYRDKISAPAEMLARAKTLQSLCQQKNVPLIINDSAELSLACKAAGVHLGQGDGSLKQARTLLGKQAIIGITCHHQIELAVQAQQAGADYVAFGRFFNSKTKPGKPLATLDLVHAAKAHLTLPIVAIGGLNEANCPPLINQGIDYIALIEEVFSAVDIKEKCLSLNRLFN